MLKAVSGMRNLKFSKTTLIVSLAILTFSIDGCPKFSRHGIKFNDPFEGNQVSKYLGGGELGGKWTRDGQCEVTLKWLNKVKEEYPDLKIGNRGQVPSLPYYANLFRDSSFVPVFGESYLTMASSTKTNLWSNTFYGDGCIGWSRFKKYQADFDPYRGILENAFSKTSHGEKQIVAAVNGIHAEENRLKETTNKVQEASLTIEALHELVAYARTAKGNLRSESQQQQDRFKANRRIPASPNSLFASLWPSEEEAFQKVLDQKLQKIAQELTTKSTKEVDSLTVSLESAQKIKNIYGPQSDEYIRFLPNSSESGVLKEALRSKLESIVAALVKEKVQRLEAISHTIGGLEQSSTWYSDFKRAFSEFRTVSQVEAGESTFAKKRNAIFHEVKPEFSKKLDTLDPNLESLAKADELLASTFSLPPDRTLASYQEYADLVTVRQTEILDHLLDRLSKQLGSIPPTLPGSYEILKWKHEFDVAYGPYKKFKGVQEVSVNWAKKREEILRDAKAEFTRKQNALSPNKEGIDRASSMLLDLFPNLEDDSLPIHEEYEMIVLSTIKDLRSRMR